MPAIKNITPHSVSVDIVEDGNVTPGAAWFVRKQVRAARRSIKIPGNSQLDFPWDVRRQQGVALLISRRILVLLNDAGQVCRVNHAGELIPVDNEHNPIYVPEAVPTPVVETDIQQEVWAGPLASTVDVEPPSAPAPVQPEEIPPLVDQIPEPEPEPEPEPALIIVDREIEEIPGVLEVAPVEAEVEAVIPELVDLPPLPSEDKTTSPVHGCPHCGFVSMTSKGLNRHIASCKAK
jgi:hypothetical protein